jgi:hypothetical protein
MVRSRILLALLALGGSARAQSAAPERYVPITGWAHDSVDRLEQWWGGQLRKMREPVMSAPGAGTGFRQRFRLLMTRSRGMPFAIRIDVRADGVAVARRVRLDNRDLTEARISEDQTVSFGRAQTLRLARAIRASDVRSVPREGPRLPDQPDKRGRFALCVHPTTYVFELVDAGGSRFVYRDGCNISYKLRKLAETVDSMVPARTSR